MRKRKDLESSLSRYPRRGCCDIKCSPAASSLARMGDREERKRERRGAGLYIPVPKDSGFCCIII